jgi:hypothetical protein
MRFVSLLLYMVLGGLLGVAGVGVVENTIAFLAILAVVIGIDINSRLMVTE